MSTFEAGKSFYAENLARCLEKKEFSNSPLTYKVLILPFHPRQNCTSKNLNAEVEVKRRLEEISEIDSLQLEVLIDASQGCPSTTREVEQIGKRLEADLVLWGEIEPKCFNDSLGACIRFLRTNAHEVVPRLELKGSTAFQIVPSISDLRDGSLMNHVDYIIYWIAGTRAKKQEKYSLALNLYEKIPDTEKQPEVYNSIGACFFALNDFTSLLKISELGIFRFQDYAPLYAWKAIALASMEQYKQALQMLNKALELSPSYGFAYYVRGSVFEEFGDNEKALMDYDKALEIIDDGPSVIASIYYNRANLLRDFGQLDKALSDFTKAIDLAPTVDYYVNRGNLFAMLQMENEALNDYNTAIKIDSNDVNAHYNRGRLLYAQGKLSEALIDFDKAIQLFQGDPDAYYNRAYIYYQLGFVEKAISDLTKVIELAPQFVAAYESRAVFFLQLGKIEVAEKDRKKARELGSNMP